MSVKIKQHDITDCGAACIASVCVHYQLKLPIARIRQKAGTDQKGTNLLGMIAAVEQLGFSAKGIKAQVEAIAQSPAASHCPCDRSAAFAPLHCAV